MHYDPGHRITGVHTTLRFRERQRWDSTLLALVSAQRDRAREELACPAPHRAPLRAPLARDTSRAPLTRDSVLAHYLRQPPFLRSVWVHPGYLVQITAREVPAALAPGAAARWSIAVSVYDSARFAGRGPRGFC